MKHTETQPLHDTPTSNGSEEAKARLLSTPTRPFDPVGASSATEILTRMQGTAFQGKQLGLAFEVWKRMLGDRCTIMMGMSGAMVPAGMRRLVVRMIEHRLDRLPGVHRREFLSRSARDAGEFPLPGLARHRRRAAGRESGGPHVRRAGG